MTEDYEHMFVKCTRVQDYLKYAKEIVKSQFKIENIAFDMRLLIFGYKVGRKEYNFLNQFIVLVFFNNYKTWRAAENKRVH